LQANGTVIASDIHAPPGPAVARRPPKPFSNGRPGIDRMTGKAMHKIEIPADVRARSKRARGRDHVLESIDVTRTAHIVVDLQKGFMAEGALVEVPVAREIVPNVNAIVASVREAGGLNVFLRYTYDASEQLTWTAWYGTFLDKDYSVDLKNAFTPGAEPWELWPSLDVQKGDLIVDKTRFSAFVPGTCKLHDMLQARGIDTLIITGTLTNCCSESTARDAMQQNYKIIFVADGNAALSDAEHNATLCNMVALFADVMTTKEVVAVVDTNATMRGAAA
jgi:ureidoacrylate peracid hydrolase